MKKLSKKMIDATTPPTTGQLFLRDPELRGLAVRFTRAGTKTFVLETAIHGRVRRMTLGRYGVLTLDQARQLAREKLVEIAHGKDPVAERQRRREAPTWLDLETMYLARHAPRKKSAIDDISLLTHHLAPWRPRTLASITREDVARLHSKMGTEPSRVIRPGRPISTPIPRTANKMLSLVRSMFNLAMDWGLFSGANPCTRLKKFPEISRDRFVTPDELPKLWTALGADPNRFVRVAFLVAILTGARKSEVLEMRWSDLDFTQNTWRIEHTKANRAHLLPLPVSAMREIRKLPRFEGNPHVFPGRWGRNHLVNVSKPWSRIRKAAGLDDVWIHDLRRTLGSWLVAAGASLPLIGKTLNHSQPSTTATYARLQLEPVRLALEQNAKRMLTYAKEKTQPDR